MTLSKMDKSILLIIIISGISSLFIVLILTFAFKLINIWFFLIYTLIACSITIVAFVIMLSTPKMEKQTDKIYFKNKQPIFKTEKNNKIIRYKINLLLVKNPPDDKICMISKLPFKDNEQALQCPSCLSLFSKNNLEDWLIEKSKCPVCKRVLKKKVKEI